MQQGHLALILFFVLLCATGCQSAITLNNSAINSEETRQTTIITQAQETTSTKTVSVDPTSLDPELKYPPASMAEAYRIAPEGYFPFIWDGYRWPYIQSENDFNKLTYGALYWLHRKTDELTLISNGPALAYTSTRDHLFYILESEPGRIYRSDYSGQEHIVVFQTDDTIGRFSYWGANKNGKLYIVIGGKQVLEHDLVSQISHVVLEQYQIDDALVFGDEETGQPYLEWYGKTGEEDTAEIHYQVISVK